MNWIRCSHFTSSLIQSKSHGYATSARASWQDKPRPTSAYWKQKRGNAQKSTKKRRASTAAASEYNFKAIPLVPETLHKHLFSSEYPSTSAQVIAEDAEVDQITLPYLEGSDQEELLRRLESRCSHYVGEYQELLKKAASMDSLPPTPTSWVFAPGWTKHEPVENPDDKALFFDIEVCVEDGLLPTLAVAASESAWYSWCSDRLVNKSELPSLNRLTHLISVEVDGGSQEERVVIGHNVAYDCARVREQYYPKQTGTKFWDTMSMSIPMFGMADHQLALYEKKSDINDELESGNGWVSAWKERVSKNSLSAVHEKLCGGISNLNIDKSVRDVFIQGSIDDIRENFQKLVTYCAADVTATFEIYKAMFPKFQQRMPSPITWFGMFEMGSTYLPITKNWRDFYDHCEKSCDAKNNEAARGVDRSSRDLLEELRSNDDYKRDPWMWAVDWNVAARSALPMPKWYQGLFDTKEVGQSKLEDIAAANVKTRSREWPRIFGLCYGPYPLFYKKDYGWGFLVPPKDADEYCTLDSVQLYSRSKS